MATSIWLVDGGGGLVNIDSDTRKVADGKKSLEESWCCTITATNKCRKSKATAEQREV
eukprot:CAMPEP_0194743432 /NCGR_PEP_ID=MMETSP0296-20130528/100308_1 /TAXON_ID=39354 /ORGANISM="Heterosigma akashiwo, Strain CCMP2393" /LENGTH=57 /DNA_ID=CAMNT_0039655457 /DNA_START=265 /DNA_END=438 /DNA_ORIENTATION=-